MVKIQYKYAGYNSNQLPKDIPVENLVMIMKVIGKSRVYWVGVI